MDEKDKFVDEILAEIIAEEKELKKRKQEIIANGCPHSEKKDHTGLFSGVKFKYCTVCNKQFDLDGIPL